MQPFSSEQFRNPREEGCQGIEKLQQGEWSAAVSAYENGEQFKLLIKEMRLFSWIKLGTFQHLWWEGSKGDHPPPRPTHPMPYHWPWEGVGPETHVHKITYVLLCQVLAYISIFYMSWCSYVFFCRMATGKRVPIWSASLRNYFRQKRAQRYNPERMIEPSLERPHFLELIKGQCQRIFGQAPLLKVSDSWDGHFPRLQK